MVVTKKGKVMDNYVFFDSVVCNFYFMYRCYKCIYLNDPFYKNISV